MGGEGLGFKNPARKQERLMKLAKEAMNRTDIKPDRMIKHACDSCNLTLKTQNPKPLPQISPKP